MTTKAIQLGLRAWQFVFTLLILALIGNMIDDSFSGNPATVNYAMYCAVFSMASLLYLFPATANIDWAGHPVIMIVLDVLNAIFFFASAIALAARLGCESCTNDGYTRNNEITNGSADRQQRCREAQASVAFLWFTWFGYCISTVFSFVMFRQAGAGSVRSRGRTAPARPSRPNMTQV